MDRWLVCVFTVKLIYLCFRSSRVGLQRMRKQAPARPPHHLSQAVRLCGKQERPIVVLLPYRDALTQLCDRVTDRNKGVMLCKCLIHTTIQ